MVENCSSTSSCSDREGFALSERNIQAVAFNCDNKRAETDLAFADDKCNSGTSTCTQIENCEKEILLHEEQICNSEAKQPITMKHIEMALKEGRTRENKYVMRESRVKTGSAGTGKAIEAPPKPPKPSSVSPSSRANVEAPDSGPTKAGFDSRKRNHAMHSLKHKVAMLISLVIIVIFF